MKTSRLNRSVKIMKKQQLYLSFCLLCGLQTGFAQTSLSTVSGAWYDSDYDGVGFNMVEAGGELYAYFYGYKGEADGEAQWLLTESGIATPVVVGQSYIINMRSGFIGNGGSFISAPTTDTSGTEYWGTLTLTFNDCNAGTASLSGNDGDITYNISKIAGISGLSCQESGAVSSLSTYCDYSVDQYNDDESVQAQSMAAWSCDDTTRYLTGNGIPDHEVGSFPNSGNPNTISEQAITENFPLTPTAAATTNNNLITIGYALNSVKVEPGTGGSCASTLNSCTLGNDGTGSWRIEALGQSTFDFGTDMNNAHVQPTGQYHYHGMPEKLMEKMNPNNDNMILVAWAMDGYPIYARYGYQDANDNNSNLVALSGSYALKSTPDSGRISTDELPMGTFAQDYEYIAGSGDLDECNGRTGVTPEFPNATYYYVFTDTYPFAPRCLKGEYTSTRPPGGG